jgi:hypothetical protein
VTARDLASVDSDDWNDATILANRGTWTPQALDDTDALLLALIQMLRNTKVGHGST